MAKQVAVVVGLAREISGYLSSHGELCLEMPDNSEGRHRNATGRLQLAAQLPQTLMLQAIAAETFAVSNSLIGTSSTPGGSSRCWCLHLVQVTASVIL